MRRGQSRPRDARVQDLTRSCTHCQEPIVGYELIVALERERVRVTSLAREPHIIDMDCELLHSQCFEARQDDLS
jgi:hypothetical protein